MRRHTVTKSLFAILLLVSSLHAADTLPTQIADSAFWKMITDFSEAGGTFDFEMFMSNEVTFQFVLPNLLKVVSPGGVYLGVGPEQNFTYISALRPRIAFIIDIRRENMIEMLMYKALFEMSANRAEFLSRLFSRKLRSSVAPQAPLSTIFVALELNGDRQLFSSGLQSIKDRLLKTHGFPLNSQDLRTLDYIYSQFFRGGPEASLTNFGTSYRVLMSYNDSQGRNRNFLAEENNFQFVRELHRKNLIVPVVGNFSGPKAIRAVAGYLKSHKAEVGAFYVSNVEEYIRWPRSTWSAYCGNLATLPVAASGTFIRFGRGGQGSFLGSMPRFINGGC
jgi:hypothetical protein